MNQPKKVLPKQGFFGYLADIFMRPLMYLTQGTFREVPQRTHRWNNKKYIPMISLDKESKVRVKGDPKACQKFWLGFIPLFHIPIFGGWREYVVIEPAESTVLWHVGWAFPVNVAMTEHGISRIPLRGPVRMLRGPKTTCFFAVTRMGRQIPLRIIGYGRIGKGGPYAKLPLL